MGTHRRHRVSMALSLALSVSMVAGAIPAYAAAPPLPGDCPSIKAVSGVKIGDRGNGWTVESGQQRERFRFEVLGTIPGGIAPGRDLIVVEISDVAGNDMIQRAGGVWAGMSGSPVYLGERLVGAIAYGFTAGPSRIAGVTPAEDMIKVLAAGSSAEEAAGPKTVTVPSALRSELSERAGVSPTEVSTFQRLPIPIAVSGLNNRGRERLSDALAERGLSAIVVPTSVAPASSALTITERPKAGGNFAGLISYGDLTVGGVGTTTYVCRGKALAFGHPLTFGGRVNFGANDARAIKVLADPTFGPFKMANIGGLFGRLRQDRLAAIGASLNQTPTVRPIRSTVTNVNTGRSRDGLTRATASDWVPDLAAFHLLGNADSVFDRIGAGTSRVAWTIKGVTSAGPFELKYSNRYASQWDISFESIFQLSDQLWMIQSNPFTPVRFTGVRINASFDEVFRLYNIERVRVSKNGGPYRERLFMNVAPGDALSVRVDLRNSRGTLSRVDFSLKVPATAEPGFGSLVVSGGPEEFVDPSSAKSFPELLDLLASTPKNYALRAILQLTNFDGQTTTITRSQSQNAVVHGQFSIEINVN